MTMNRQLEKGAPRARDRSRDSVNSYGKIKPLQTVMYPELHGSQLKAGKSKRRIKN